jgi:N-glycosylase/DNA lyase
MNAQELEAFKQNFTKDYLNTEVNVEALYKVWSEKDPKYFAKIPLKGIRCLRQDPWECTLSFICSQNNNIKRITQLVKTLRNTYGKPICKAIIND